MRYRRSIAVGAAALLAPLTAFAQPITGTVTIGPGEQVPSLSMPLIALLAVALAGIALYRLRVRGPLIGLMLIVMAAVAGYAMVGGLITITGGECAMQTTHMFYPGDLLMSECSNGIQILDIQLSCVDPPPPNQCRVGKTLMRGQSCTLPECPF